MYLKNIIIILCLGYGNIGPRTILGKAVTMGYAALGIPLMLIYLSSIGSLLSGCARGVFTKSICCCLCSNCGYCCYDEKMMQEKEHKMRKKREQKEYEQQIQSVHLHQEPFYMRSPSSTFTTSTSNNIHSPVCVDTDELKMSATRASSIFMDSDCLSSNLSAAPYIKHEKVPYGSCLAPISFCFVIMVGYICGGSAVLCHLEHSLSFLDSIFFCFMTLSTIGFGDSIPASSVFTTKSNQNIIEGNIAIWFCSLYILVGMALTAMCFNVVHDEVVYRLKIHYNESKIRQIFKEGTFSTKLGSNINFLNSDSTGNNLIEYPLASWHQNINNIKACSVASYESKKNIKANEFRLNKSIDTEGESNLINIDQSEKFTANYEPNFKCVDTEPQDGKSSTEMGTTSPVGQFGSFSIIKFSGVVKNDFGSLLEQSAQNTVNTVSLKT